MNKSHICYTYVESEPTWLHVGGGADVEGNKTSRAVLSYHQLIIGSTVKTLKAVDFTSVQLSRASRSVGRKNRLFYDQLSTTSN